MALVVILTLLLAYVSPSPSSQPTGDPCFHDATVIKPVPPDVHDLMGDFLTAPLATKVQIMVAPDRTVKNASVSKSSGFIQFDMAVLQAAKISKYRPKVVDCEPVEGTATFWGTWGPGPPP
jgi:TonB family protein